MEAWIIGSVIAALVAAAVGIFIAGFLAVSGRCADEEDRFAREWIANHKKSNGEEENHVNFVS